jgi:hypothetical protein
MNDVLVDATKKALGEIDPLEDALRRTGNAA